MSCREIAIACRRSFHAGFHRFSNSRTISSTAARGVVPTENLYVAGKRYPSSVGVGTSRRRRSTVSPTAAATDSGGASIVRASSGTICTSAYPSGIVIVCTTALPPVIAESRSAYEAPRRNSYVPGLSVRSLPRAPAYARKRRAERTTPARSSDSAAARMLDPGGMTTRIGAPDPPPPPHAASVVRQQSAAAAAAGAAARRGAPRRRSAGEEQGMLEEHGGGEGVHVALAAPRRPAHLADRAERRRGRESLVDEPHREPRALLELRRDVARLGGALGLVAVLVERKADHEPAGLQLLRAPDDLRHRRALAGAAHDEAGRGGDRPGGVADGEPHAAVAVVDGEQAHEPTGLGRGQPPCAMRTKNSRLFFESCMRLRRNVIASSLGMSPRKLRSR